MAKSVQTAPKEVELPWYIAILRKEWATMKGAPFSFIGCVVICTALLGIGIHRFVDHLYAAEIKGNEATMKLKDALVVNISEERDFYLRKLQDAGIVSTPLKKRAVILVDDLIKFADNWPTNADSNAMFWKFKSRFEVRISKTVSELEEQGLHSTDFDDDSEFSRNWNDLMGFNTNKVYRMAKTIKGLAGGLKE